MEFHISSWTALPNRLKIRVGTSPLSMGKDYIWAHHTTNHYGQGMKWCWWNVSQTIDPTEEVYGKQAQDLLSRLVTGHNVLKLLAPHYKIPFLPIGDDSVSG